MRTALLLIPLSLAAIAPAHAASGIAALQRELRQAGYYAGPANGVMTGKTQQAIRAYRQNAGRSPPQPTLAVRDVGDAVVRAQQALQQQGYLRGPADGVLGPLTRDAIIRFEAAHGIAVDPRVSDTLLAELAAPSGAAAAPAAPVAAPAAQPPQPPAGSGRQPLPTGVRPPPIR